MKKAEFPNAGSTETESTGSERSLLMPAANEEEGTLHSPWFNSSFMRPWEENASVRDVLDPSRTSRSSIARLCEDGIPKMPVRVLARLFVTFGTAVMVSNLAYSFASEWVQREEVKAYLDPNHPAIQTAIVLFTIFAGASVGSLYLMLSDQAIDRINYQRAAIHYCSTQGSRSELPKIVFKKALGALWAVVFAGFATYTWLGLEYRVFNETLEHLLPQTWYRDLMSVLVSFSRMVGGTISRSVALEELFFIMLTIKNKLLKNPPRLFRRWKLSSEEIRILRIQKKLAACILAVHDSPPEEIKRLFIQNECSPSNLMKAMVLQIPPHNKTVKNPWKKWAGIAGLLVGFIFGARSSQLFWDVTSAGAAEAGSVLDGVLKVFNLVGSGGLFVPKVAMTFKKTTQKMVSGCLGVTEKKPPSLRTAPVPASSGASLISLLWYMGLVLWVGGCTVASGLSRLKAFTETDASLDLIIIGLISFLITEAWGARGVYSLVTHYVKSRKHNPEIQSELRTSLFRMSGGVSVMQGEDVLFVERSLRAPGDPM